MSKAGGSNEVMKQLRETALAVIFMEAPIERIKDVSVKEVLREIKASKTFEENSKAISKVGKAEVLKSTLFYLRGLDEVKNNTEINGHTVPGLVRCILLEVQNLLPYKCNSCHNTVSNKRSVKSMVSCRGCGIGACPDCFTDEKVGWSFLCSPCGTTVDNNRMTPIHLLNAQASRARKKQVSQSIEVEVINEDLVPNETDDETDDEISGIPLGQRTPQPQFQSTQSEASVSAPGGFPELNFTEVINSQGEASGSGVDSGAEVVSEVIVEDSAAITEEGEASGSDGDSGPEVVMETSTAIEDDFIEPPKRVRSEKKKQKAVYNSKDVRGAKSSQPQASQASQNKEGDTTAKCRFFMRGACKYGFYGKGKAGQGRCPFTHPKPCRKFMDNGAGEGGCSKGRDCEAAHPRMCHQSLTTRTCTNIKDGARCITGYHVRGTKAPASKPPGASNKTTGARAEADKPAPKKTRDPNQAWSSASSPPQVLPVNNSVPSSSQPSLGEQQLALSSVFGELIRAEVIKLLQTGTMWPQRTSQQNGLANSPPVSFSAPKGQDPTITMGSLGALLSLMGNQHQ
jgi:hypothetical protein